MADRNAIVIGGGFYGCSLALYLKAAGYQVEILEQGQTLLGRASLINQARVHYGYHYPRSFVTAVRSAINFPRFTLDFRHAVVEGFDKVYAIAKRGSKVSASQFHAFCKDSESNHMRSRWGVGLLRDPMCSGHLSLDVKNFSLSNARTHSL